MVGIVDSHLRFRDMPHRVFPIIVIIGKHITTKLLSSLSLPHTLMIEETSNVREGFGLLYLSTYHASMNKTFLVHYCLTANAANLNRLRVLESGFTLDFFYYCRCQLKHTNLHTQ